MAFLAKALKSDLVKLADDLGIEATSSMSKAAIKALILASDTYSEEDAKAMLEATKEEREKEEQREQRAYELERLKLTNLQIMQGSTPQSSDNTVRISAPQMHQMMPKFNIEETDISLYLSIFERQAKNAQIEETEWTSQILSLLPIEIGQIILRETEENTKDYSFVKKTLLDRFKLSPEAFRQKFVMHSRKQNIRWKDFAYELQNYLEGWINGLGIKTLDDLKLLMVADQMKRKVHTEVKAHYLEEWGEIASPFVLAEKLDKFGKILGDP